MKKRRAKSNKYSTSVLESVGHEIKMNPPKILAHTRARFGAADAERQRIAILLNKARRRGAKIKRRKKAK